MKRVLYDTNVLLDVWLERQPHVRASAPAVAYASQGLVGGLVAGHAVTTLAYLLQGEFGAAKTRNLIAGLLRRFQVAPVTDAVVRRALLSDLRDFEDAVTCEAALEAGATVIVTRDVHDFRGSPIPAIPPEDLRP